jgi:hypothetical protein
MDTRRAQLMCSFCWCSQPDFAWEGDSDGANDPDEENDEENAEVYWCTITVGRLSFKQLDRWRADISLVLPAAAWYFGATEHHVGEVSDFVHQLHGCVFILIAFAKPYSLQTLRAAIDKSSLRVRGESVLCMRPGPEVHRTGDGSEVLSLVTWTMNRLEFISLVATVRETDGLGRGVFGYSGIIEVFGRQFGPAVSFMAEEMELAKLCSDEEDGVLPAGGGFHTENPLGREGETIYVAES